MFLQQVRLHFLSYTFNSSDCNYKSINVYDGSDNMAPLLHSYCDGVWPGDVISSGSTVFVSYVTRYRGAGDTFRIKYSAVVPKEGTINGCNKDCHMCSIYRVTQKTEPIQMFINPT